MIYTLLSEFLLHLSVLYIITILIDEVSARGYAALFMKAKRNVYLELYIHA